MNINKNLVVYFLALIQLVWFSLPSDLAGQILDWDYENILTDTYQSGAHADMVTDHLGNIHISYWDREAEKLMYGVRDKATGQWSIERIADTGNYGFISAITADPSGNIHIAYIKDQSGKAYIRYAHNSSGSWSVESVLPQKDIGIYGKDNIFPSFIQHSLDIRVNGSGQPAILFFNGNISSYIQCPTPIGQTYGNYDLDMNLTERDGSGNWSLHEFANIPDKYNTVCLPQGDRFGEFSRLVPGMNGEYHAITNSLHNHDLLFFSSAPNDLFNWTYKPLDSLGNWYSVAPRNFRESFDYIDATFSGDSTIHVAYGLSNLYGNVSSDPTRRTFYYAKINLNEVNDSAYSPYIFQFLPKTIYRSYYSIAASSSDTVALTYYSIPDRNLVLAYSDNGGFSWEEDTVDHIITNTYTRSEIYGDSVFVLYYDADKDFLKLASRKVSGSQWNIEQATVSELSGDYISSQIIRTGNSDDIHIAYSERMTGAVLYGSRENSVWNFEQVDIAGEEEGNLKLEISDQGKPCIVYANQVADELKIACKPASSWQTYVVDTGVSPRAMGFASVGDSLHICFFDLETGHLKYARAAAVAGPWDISTLDSSSLIVGQRLDMHKDDSGNLYIGYVDPFNEILKYARKPFGQSWEKEDVTIAFNYSPGALSVKTNSVGTPLIAFRDASDNSIFLAEKTSPNSWGINEVFIDDVTNLIGSPLDLIIDSEDRPWVLYNYSSIHDEVRLVRLDPAGDWQQVSILNNAAEISGTFDFHLVGDDFYILGRKNQVDNLGIGMLYAESGVRTAVESDLVAASLKLIPNPVKGTGYVSFSLPAATKISVDIYNLSGKNIHSVVDDNYFLPGNHQLEWPASNLPAGVYLCKITGDGFSVTKKWVVLP